LVVVQEEVMAVAQEEVIAVAQEEVIAIAQEEVIAVAQEEVIAVAQEEVIAVAQEVDLSDLVQAALEAQGEAKSPSMEAVTAVQEVFILMETRLKLMVNKAFERWMTDL